MMVIEIVTDKAVRRMTVKVREDKCAIIVGNSFFTSASWKVTTACFFSLALFYVPHLDPIP